MTSDLLSTRQVSAWMLKRGHKFTPEAVRNAIKRGELVAKKMGGDWFVSQKYLCEEFGVTPIPVEEVELLDADGNRKPIPMVTTRKAA